MYITTFRFPNFFEWSLDKNDYNQTVPQPTEFRRNETWTMVRNILLVYLALN